MTTARKNKDHEHYVNNREFSQAVVDHVNGVRAAKLAEKPEPRIPEYVGRCFLRICEGLSHKPNFIRYTYRDEMVSDAIENCIKAIMNYNVEAATRSGSPNAFAYFTQIAYYAFLRRIAKEKKQQDIKYSYMEHCGVDDMMTGHESGDGGGENSFLEQIKKKSPKKDMIDVYFDKRKEAEVKGIETFMEDDK